MDPIDKIDAHVEARFELISRLGKGVRNVATQASTTRLYEENIHARRLACCLALLHVSNRRGEPRWR